LFDSRFIVIVLTAPTTIAEVLKDTRGVVGQDNLSLEQVRSLRIPLLPIAHQRRIVAKVEELMALCDRLEAQLTIAQTESRHLLEAVLHEALAPLAA
jgi:type I restriction enzyme, S subunit